MSIPSEDLKQIKDLYDAGVLTKEEYELKKRQLLGLDQNNETSKVHQSVTYSNDEFSVGHAMNNTKEAGIDNSTDAVENRYEVYATLIQILQGENGVLDRWNYNLENACVSITDVCPTYNTLWNSLKNYYSKKMGMSVEGALIPFHFSDVVRVQMLYRISLGFSMLLYTFLESVGKHKEIGDLYPITTAYTFWYGKANEEMTATIGDKYGQAVTLNYTDFDRLDTRARNYTEWMKEWVEEPVLSNLIETESGRILVTLGYMIIGIAEEKKRTKSGFLGMNTKEERVVDPQLRKDVALYLTRAIPVINDSVESLS